MPGYHLFFGFLSLDGQVLLSFFLFLGACAGHTALMVAGLNCLYGLAWPRWVYKFLRRLCVLLLLGFPLLFWCAAGADLFAPALAEPWRAVLTAYSRFCAVVGFGIVPPLSVWRCLQRAPAVLLNNHTTTIDVAEALGYLPCGQGKHHWMFRLPLNEVCQVDFSERTLCLPRLPAAWDGLTILHLSDLHLCGSPDRTFYYYVMDRCREWEPDLVAVTGDLVDNDAHLRWIAPALGRLRWRIAAFAVLGNHDAWHESALVRRRLRKVGMRVLNNRWEQINVCGEPMTVIGHEGPWFSPGPDLAAGPTEIFRLCLSHTPDNIVWAKQNHVDLLLAGHTHGGQVRFPLIGSVFVPSRHSRRYDLGIFHEPPTVLHVSRGLSGQYPLRYLCRPEVTKLVLRPTHAVIQQ